MLGDTAVAVHPDPAAALDKAGAELREKLLTAHRQREGRASKSKSTLLMRPPRRRCCRSSTNSATWPSAACKLELPLTGRKIPLITDEWAKPELGSGCVKITPAHDANDYDVWQRHPEIGVDQHPERPTARSTTTCPKNTAASTMHTKAREAVVADMEAAGLVAEIEDREIDLAHSDRSKTPIEPYLADQWFMKMDDDSHPRTAEPSDQACQTAMDAVTTAA